jgi:hypothetical protein
MGEQTGGVRGVQGVQEFEEFEEFKEFEERPVGSSLGLTKTAFATLSVWKRYLPPLERRL